MYRIRASNKKNKIITLELSALKKKSYNDLRDGSKTIWDITEDDLKSSFRDVSVLSAASGYSILFTDGEKTKILQFNTK